MRLILTRHGETDKNVAGLVYGTLPSKLTENGQKQALELAATLRTFKLDHIFCSDLDRCVETAAPTIALHPRTPASYDALLREQGQGSLIGMQVKDVDWHNLPPDVETPDQMADRARKFLSGLDLASDESALIISHRRFLNTFVNVLLGVAPDRDDTGSLLKNSSLTIIDCRRVGEGTITKLNAADHLSNVLG